MKNVQEDYYSNNKPLSQTSRFKQQNKLFMEKKGRNIEELNDRWKTNPAFLEDTTGHLNNLNKGLQGKGKLITDDDDDDDNNNVRSSIRNIGCLQNFSSLPGSWR
jgi:hypothetical protein